MTRDHEDLEDYGLVMIARFKACLVINNRETHFLRLTRVERKQ